MFRHDAALASGKLTRGSPGGQLTYMEVIMSSLKDRTATFTYRKVDSARLRTAQLDVMEFLRQFLQHVLPEGFQKVRHFGFLHASCAIPLATIRLLIGQGQPSEGGPPTPPRAARCPTCGAPMRVVMRVWTSPRAFVDTS